MLVGSNISGEQDAPNLIEPVFSREQKHFLVLGLSVHGPQTANQADSTDPVSYTHLVDSGPMDTFSL